MEQRTKKCNKCGEVRSFDDFWNDKSKKDGKHTICRQCKSNGRVKSKIKDTDKQETVKGIIENLLELVTVSATETKKCNKCLMFKSKDEFFNDRSKKDGKHTICKTCQGYVSKNIDFERDKQILDYFETIIQEYKRNNSQEIKNNTKIHIRLPVKRCSKCNENKTLDQFSKKLGKICKSCCSKYDSKYRNTFNGFFKDMLNSMKKHANTRLDKRGIIEINKEDLINLWHKQEGKCYYSGIVMNCKTNHNWKCSPERLDPNIGYTKENTVLVCLEFNIQKQWSLNKMESLINLVKIEHDSDKIIEDITIQLNHKKEIKRRKNREKHVIENIEYLECNYCGEFKPYDNFVKKRNQYTTICKTCKAKDTKNRRSTIKGKLRRLLDNAKQRTRNRIVGENSKRIDNKFDLTLDDLIKILIEQRGLCAYSGIKMNYGSCLEEDWVISLERIDPLKGYTRNNVCLICLEFNGADHSPKSKFISNGSGAWSKEKFNIFLKSIETKYDNQNTTL